MPMPCDYNNYAIDFCHMLACYWIVGQHRVNSNSKPDNNFLLCPQMGEANKDSSAFLTTCLRDISPQYSKGNYPTYEDMPHNIKGGSIRIGAANEIADHPLSTFNHVVTRGGWYFANLCRAFVYLLSLRRPAREAAQALGGWPNLRTKAIGPRLVFFEELPPQRQQAFNNFMIELFGCSSCQLLLDRQRLFPLVEICMASFLMWYDKFYEV
jgi:hypothetical protein